MMMALDIFYARAHCHVSDAALSYTQAIRKIGMAEMVNSSIGNNFGAAMLLSALALAGCSGDAGADGDDARASDGEEIVEVKEYVSKTPNAKIYMQPAPDPNIVLKPEGMRGGSVDIDINTGDKVRMQTADHERRINYFAYSTKDDELVRVFMTQYGGGTYKSHWKVFPIRVWNIEEAKKVTPAVEAARERATIERLAEFISSGPDWRDRENAFMIIDAPISEEDPL